ncbi:MAG: hypothetical protein IJ379_14395 [Lachnospiraceae bacterium]|nr:hypothetical protein [Lachnospiraceae bacterium]MBQ7777103.1 hypothetical protein [Lachnospiraceae bacterium]
MDHKEEKRRTNQRELELYQCIVHTDVAGYQIEDGQTELTYEQRMLYLYTERKIFERMGRDLGVTDRKPSEVLAEKYGEVVDAYIPKEQQVTALALLDRYPLFSYTRKEVLARSKRFSHPYRLYHFFEDFKKQELPQKSANITAVLLDGTQGESIEEELEQKLLNILNGAEGGPRPDWEVYALAKGMVMSQNERLLHMLIEQVKNNKVKEDLRKELCRAIAEGPVEAFLLLFQTLVEHRMAKYRSVRRCVAAWTGLYDKKTYEQITDDTLEHIWKSLTEEAYRKKLLQSSESKEFYLGLWAEGCFSVEKAMEEGLSCMKEGAWQNKLAVAYYAMPIEKRQFSSGLMEIALEASEGTEEDLQLLAALLPGYLRDAEGGCNVGSEIDEILHEDLRSSVRPEVMPPREHLTYAKYFDSEEQAGMHFSLLRKLYDNLPKKKQHYDLQQLPIGNVWISQGEMVERLLLIAHCLQDEALIDEVCPLIPSVDSDYREFCFEMCCTVPKTDVQRKTLIRALSDKKFAYVKSEAEHILMEDFDREQKAFKTLKFSEEELAQISKSVRPFLKEWFYL